MKIEGKGGISAKIIADSVSSITGKRITTFELNYPRFIHAEMLTHRLFSRNAASSRAIPVKKLVELVEKRPARPIHWGKNQPGMKAKEECNSEVEFHDYNAGRYHCELSREEAWDCAADAAAMMASAMSEAGYHKQIVNRLLEPFQFIKVVVTATEYENFFHLRDHEDAQPEIAELASVMRKAYRMNPHVKVLNPGEWHLPYVDNRRTKDGELVYTVPAEGDDYTLAGELRLTLEQALKVSASCCGQVSYRVLDNGLEKAEKIYQQLVESKPVHSSPFEHAATPMNCVLEVTGDGGYETNASILAQNSEGITHMDKEGNLWSGNFCGWIQHRQLIPNNVVM